MFWTTIGYSQWRRAQITLGRYGKCSTPSLQCAVDLLYNLSISVVTCDRQIKLTTLAMVDAPWQKAEMVGLAQLHSVKRGFREKYAISGDTHIHLQHSAGYTDGNRW